MPMRGMRNGRDLHDIRERNRVGFGIAALKDEETSLINNRQGGRRRGRGGGGGQGPRQQGGPRDSGNRIDSRARGNAAQLLEKYRNMARDAQMSGDRVNTEYYLQFADHYFRVLADQRGRYEENGQQPQRRQRDDFDLDDDFGDEGEPVRAEEQPRAAEDNRQRRNDRGDREERGNRRDTRGASEGGGSEGGEDRGNRGRQRFDRDDRDRNDDGGRNGYRQREAAEASAPVEAVADTAVPDAPAEAAEQPRRRGRPRKVREDVPAEAAGESGGVDADRLPPALNLAANDATDDEPKPRRRRTRAAAEAPAT